MKKVYIGPEAELLCFAPVEKLSLINEVDFDEVKNMGMDAPETEVPPTSEGDDIDIPA